MVSTKINGLSHWFNRLTVSGQDLDVDLTGDQFGHPPLQVAPAGSLYPATLIRSELDVKEETLTRARRLALRAEMIGAARKIDAMLNEQSRSLAHGLEPTRRRGAIR